MELSVSENLVFLNKEKNLDLILLSENEICLT